MRKPYHCRAVLKYLEIPVTNSGKRKGLPVYDGPYKNEGRKCFDQAITCEGKTITYHFKTPWPDLQAQEPRGAPGAAVGHQQGRSGEPDVRGCRADRSAR